MRSKPVNSIPGITGRISIIPASLAFILTVLAVCSVCISAAVADTAGNTDDVMSDPSHSNKADPDYSVVFPGDQVNSMTITIPAANWEIMLANMTEMYGEFGGTATGNAAGDQQAPGHAQGMPGMSGSTDPVYVSADVSFEGLEWEHVGIRFKGFNSLQGSWSEGSYKIALKLNFDKYEDDYPEIKNQRFYGFDELNLQGAYNDDSLIRDMIVPSIFRDSGVAAPQTAFYRVYVDYGEGPVYFGIYTMIESVEDTVIETQFSDDSGNLYKPEGNGATFAAGTFDTGCFEKKTNEDDSDWGDVEKLYTVLNSDTRLSNPEQWRSELEEVFDVDIFLRWLATNTVIQNWDTYGGNCRNFYLYNDPTDGKIKWIPWDNNYALSSGMNNGNTPQGFPNNTPENRTPVWQGGLNRTGSRVSLQALTGEVNIQTTTGLTRSASRTSLQPFTDDSTIPSINNFNRSSTQVSLRTFSDAATPLTINGFVRDSTQVSLTTAPDNAVVPGDRGAGNWSPGDMNAGGGMGRTLSISLDEAGDNWPLIRYLADDPVYYAKYRNYLEMVITTSFEPDRMEETYRYYHSLIEPYVTGPEGEQDRYTHLDNPEDFDTALQELINHAYDRYDAVTEYLSAALTPTLIPPITPTATPTQNIIAVPDTGTPTVSIITPARSGVATPGQSLGIAWSAAGTGDIADVTLEYSVNGRTWTVIADNLPSEGTYSWTVPGLPGSLLMLKITATDDSGNEGSATRVCMISSQGSRASAFSAASTENTTSASSLRADLLEKYRLSRSDSLQESQATALLAASAGNGISRWAPGADLLDNHRVSQQASLQNVRETTLPSALQERAYSTGES